MPEREVCGALMPQRSREPSEYKMRGALTKTSLNGYFYAVALNCRWYDMDKKRKLLHDK